MSHLFGKFLNEIYNVIFKKNLDNELNYYRENGYVDYRVGCDLCEKGNACGLKTNDWKRRELLQAYYHGLCDGIKKINEGH